MKRLRLNKIEIKKEIQRMILMNDYCVYSAKIIGDFVEENLETNQEYYEKNKEDYEKNKEDFNEIIKGWQDKAKEESNHSPHSREKQSKVDGSGKLELQNTDLTPADTEPDDRASNNEDDSGSLKSKESKIADELNKDYSLTKQSEQEEGK